LSSRTAGPASTTGFAAWVRSRRVALLLTQEQLAERAGLSVRTVRNLEAGTVSPRESTRQLLGAVFGGAEGGRPAEGPGVPIPAQLPPDVHGFTGRADELEALDGLLTGADREPHALVISAVSGTAGVGKTALAVHWARRVADRFPDGQLFLDLRGYGPDDPLPAATALEVLLLDLGVGAAQLPQRLDQRMALYRSLVADRRMLVLLDNARSADQVRPLLPGSGTCLVVVTSRDSLSGLVARDGARRLDLDLLPEPDALLLLRTLLGERVDAEPDAARGIAEHCARLPLALRVTAELAAARRDVPLRTLAHELGDEQRRLDLLDAGGDVRTAARTVFSWSYRHLGHAPARAFRLLGLHPGRQWDAAAVAALLGVEVGTAEQVLDVLVRAHLVTLAGRPGRYGMHDLLHAYAAALTAKRDSESERRAALARLFDAYLAEAEACIHALWPDERRRRAPAASAGAVAVRSPDASEARAWLDTERSNLLAIATHPASRSWSRHAIGLSQVLWRYLNVGAHHREATVVHGCALAAARRHGDRDAEATVLRYLALVAWRLGRFDEALRLSGEALALHRQLGDRRAEGRALNTLGVSNYFLGRYHDAIANYREAHAIAVETGDGLTEGIASNNLGDTYLRIGRYAEAIRHLKDALAVRRATGDRAGQGVTIGNLAEAQRAAGRVLEARKSYDHALGLAAEMGDRNTEAYVLNGLGLLLQHQRRHGDALPLHQRALAIARDTGNRPVETTALNGLAGAVLADGDVHLGRALHETALGLATDIGERYERGRALEGLARALDAADQPADAHQRRQEALTLYEDLGVPEAEALRRDLATAGTSRG
jgi:tetratricopeptide (TPR) repeat protein/transcriptional regulator with XRE-family HTH domain